MNKRITSILLCFVMLFSMLVSAVPANAASTDAPMFTIEADKTEASPGDTITYKVYLQQPDTITAFGLYLVIPDGLTFVADSGQLATTAVSLFGATLDYTKEEYLLSWYSGSGDDITDKSKLELMTFKCTVDADATIGAQYEVNMEDVELIAGSTQDYDDITSTIAITTAKVNIVAKPISVTGVTIDETMSIKTGESKDLTVTVDPADATNKEVTFSVTGDAVTVDANGKVTGVKEGTATVTVTTADGNFTDTCTVTVACSHANKTATNEKESDCKDQGWDAYSTCNDCGQLFNAAGEEISEIPYRPLSTRHTGGTATCTAQAVCTVCSQPYGDMLDHDFTKEEKKPEALKTAGDCGQEAVYIKSCSVCGKVDTNENNTFLGEKDPDNHANYGTYLDQAAEPDHKNGVDGYTGDKRCNSCKKILENGQAILAGAHVPADVWSNDPTHHWKECTVTGCGIVIDGSKAEHKSEKAENKAACGKQAVCDVCGIGYGEIPTHEFTKEEIKAAALKTAGDCGQEAVYIKSCVHCGQVDTDTDNTFRGEKDANNHANYGTYLDGVAAVDHKNGVDGYTGDKHCNKCDALIEKGQAILAGAHVPADAWSKDPTHHWKECTVTGCGIVIDGSKAEHKSEKAENKAACEKQAVCDVCGVGYGEIPHHNYGTKKPEQPAEIGETGLKAHYQCSECQKYFVDVEHDTHIEKKEVAYEDLIIPALVDNELTIEIPFSVVVKKTGDLDPAKETFTFKMFDLGYEDTIYTVEGLTVETNGVNTYTGKLVIKVKESQFGNLSEGFKFAQVKGTSDGWTYDETVYYLAPQVFETGVISFIIFPGEDGWGNTTLEKVEFTNSYNKAKEPDQPEAPKPSESTKPEAPKPSESTKPEAPKPSESTKPSDNPLTGYNSMTWLYILLFVSGCGVVATTVLGRKRHSVR